MDSYTIPLLVALPLKRPDMFVGNLISNVPGSFRLCSHNAGGENGFENGENVTVAKFELAFTRCRNNLKTV